MILLTALAFMKSMGIASLKDYCCHQGGSATNIKDHNCTALYKILLSIEVICLHSKILILISYPVYVNYFGLVTRVKV